VQEPNLRGGKANSDFKHSMLDVSIFRHVRPGCVIHLGINELICGNTHSKFRIERLAVLAVSTCPRFAMVRLSMKTIHDDLSHSWISRHDTFSQYPLQHLGCSVFHRGAYVSYSNPVAVVSWAGTHYRTARGTLPRNLQARNDERRAVRFLYARRGSDKILATSAAGSSCPVISFT
jgi:hypothetical protein